MKTVLKEPSPEKRITISTSNVFRLVQKSEIIFLKSDSCYTKIYLNDKSCYTVCKTLKTYKVDLNSMEFIHCHRSFIVNARYVREIISLKHDFFLLTTGERIPISRRKLNESRNKLVSAVMYLELTAAVY